MRDRMKREDRKAAIAAYKERRPAIGVYAIECAATGEIWIGSSPDLEKIRNRHWFLLRQGGHTVPALQEAWRRHGEATLRFEVLEELDEDVSELARKRVLKERLAHWRDARAAAAI